MFGSALREDFRPDSDVDVLVSIDPRAHIGLFEIAQMQIELEKMFKRPVDLVEKECLLVDRDEGDGFGLCRAEAERHDRNGDGQDEFGSK